MWAVLALALWLAWIAIQASGGSLTWISIAEAPHVWHAHEMVCGFATAAIAGFLLTAVPNWTGALPIKGRPLAALFAVWVAGRIAMALSAELSPLVVGSIDVAFIPTLGAFAARQLMVKPERKNMAFLAMLVVMAGANVAYHLDVAGLATGDPLAAIRIALLTVVLMITMIGGRIIPAFTHNWLHLNAPWSPMPRRNQRLDALAVASVVVLIITRMLNPGDLLIGIVALVAGVANGARLAGWRGLATRASPIVFVLHVGYAWLVVGFFAVAIAALTDWLPEAAAMHALATGGIGTMILAVMSRASLGHTGRPLTVPPLVALSYWLVTAAAITRTFVPSLWPQGYYAAMIAAGILWMAAFALFAIVYGPMLVTPRVRQRTAPA